MLGRNTITLNQATVIEALQEYFDKRYTPKIKVASVLKNNSSNGSTHEFDVELSGEKTSND